MALVCVVGGLGEAMTYMGSECTLVAGWNQYEVAFTWLLAMQQFTQVQMMEIRQETPNRYIQTILFFFHDVSTAHIHQHASLPPNLVFPLSLLLPTTASAHAHPPPPKKGAAYIFARNRHA